jgi:phage/plasmid-associated DNA primase
MISNTDLSGVQRDDILFSDTEDEYEDDNENDNKNYDNNKNFDADADDDDDDEECESVDIDILERFDRHKLSYIVNNKELFETNKKHYYANKNPFSDAKLYLERSIFGIKQTKLRQNNGKGRFFALEPSLQNLPRFIRHPIAKDFYDDLDIENSGPTILQYLCRINQFESPELDKYVKDRDSYLNIAGFTRDEAKDLYIKIINGGNPASNFKSIPEFAHKLHQEIKYIHRDFCRSQSNKYHTYISGSDKRKNSYSKEGSYVGSLVYVVENMIIQAIIEFFDSVKYYVPCFDGVLLEKGVVQKKDIRKCERHIKKCLDIDIKLKIKDMEEEFNIPDIIPQYQPAIEKYANKVVDIIPMMNDMINNMDINDNTLSKLYCHILADDVKVTSKKGDGYKWCFEKKIWEPRTADSLLAEMANDDNILLAAISHIIKQTEFDMKCLLMKANKLDDEANITSNKKKKNKLLAECKGIKAYCDGLGKKKMQQIGLKTGLQTVRNMTNSYVLSKKTLQDKSFLDSCNRKHDYFPIMGGLVLDLKTGEIRERTREDLFTLECPVNYIPEDQWTEEDNKILHDFVDKLFIELPDYIAFMRIKLGSYLSGKNSRKFDLFHGDGQNGKSALFKALSLIFGDFCSIIGTNVVTSNAKAKKMESKGGHTSHMMPIDGKRFVLTQELEEGCDLDTTNIKLITSSDPIGGCRELYGETKTIFPMCSLGIATNHMPSLNVQESSVVDRMEVEPFWARFLNDEEMKQEKASGKYDPSRYTYYKKDDALIKNYQSCGRPLDILFSWMVGGCMEFYRTYNTGYPRPEIVSQYKSKKVDENDIIGQFLDEKCKIVIKSDWDKMEKSVQKLYKMKALDLYNEFSEWAKQNDCHAGYGKTKVYSYMNSRIGKTGNKRNIYERIRIKTPYDDE